jgi:uncharacterized membrane protein YedE/YeeE
MGGALLVTLPAYKALRFNEATDPGAGAGFRAWGRRPVDGSHVAGGLLFGAGWGLAGLCPGPAMVNAGLRESRSLVFVAVLFGLRVGLDRLQLQNKGKAA